MKRAGVEIARTLRKLPTDAEKLFWNRIRNRQIANAKFRRQFPIGPYVVDFLCAESRLIVEIDGGQHADSEADRVRTTDLNARGYLVIRFWNHDVLQNIEGVLESLTEALAAPHPDPLPEGERE